jgi:hypothetical protein
MNKHLLFVLLICLQIVASTQAVTAAAKPSWVKQRPSGTDYYIGIGMAFKGAEDKNLQYTRDARSKALTEMCSEIKVTISSNSLLQQFEQNNMFREEFESKIHTSVAQTLESYEVVTWENKKEYWVMVRLNKEKYELRRRQKLDQAKMLASSYFQSARQAAERGEVAQAISNYFKAVTALEDHVGEDLTHRTANGTINFSIDIMQDLRQLYHQVVFRPIQPTYRLEFSRQLQEPLTVAVVMQNKNDEMPVNGLPVEFLFSNGNGVLIPQPATDLNGRVQCSVSRLISKRKQQEVTARLDLAAILKLENLDSPLLPYFFPGDDLPSTRMGIELNKATAYLDLDESVFGKENNTLPFGNSIKAELNENFFTFTDDRNVADYIVRLSLRFRKGDEKQGKGYTVFLVYSDLHLSIISAKQQSEIFSDGFLEVRGMRPGSYEHALKEARETMLTKFRNEILPKLEEVDM